MTESDYSIKPLPTLPNVTGLNPAKGGEDQHKRQRSRKRPGDEPNLADDQANEIEKDEHNTVVKNNANDQHIDYCA